MRRVRPFSASGLPRVHGSNAVVNSRYTPYNFIFKNLWEQFSRPLNCYFLFVAMLQFISVIAPVSPLSTFLPLLFAFTLTAVKEGFDDVKRHRQDAVYNAKERLVLHPERLIWVHKRTQDIQVGDVLLLTEDEDVPCDVVVVAATGSRARVFIRTDNFDGEVDLKPRDVLQPPASSSSSAARSPAAAPGMSIDDGVPLADLARSAARLEFLCPPPSSVMEAFDGHAKFNVGTPDEVLVPLHHTHLVPQSTVLKQVKRAVAVAVYAGDDTKCGMNKHPAPVKWAKIDKDVSFFSILIFCCQMVNAFGFGLFGYSMNRDVSRRFWYLPEPRAEQGAKALFIYPLRFFLLTTVMIPVSFKFVVDMSKYYIALTVDWDASMSVAPPRGSHGAHASVTTTRVKNSSILEDLGQIDYVLSDKTGTMTANEMELLYVSVKPGVKVRIPNGQDAIMNPGSAGTSAPHEATAAVSWLACAMALCHTVEVAPAGEPREGQSSQEPVYEGASPDEVALCQGAAKLGVTLVERRDEYLTLRYKETAEERVRGPVASSATQRTVRWKVHHTFGFTSERKTMGVIAEDTTTGSVHFFLKGADDRMRPALDPHEISANATLEQHLREYAGYGLRTLLVAERPLSPSELHAFLEAQRECELVLHDRQAALDTLRSRMEKGMHLLGMTAIEDKLQERVADTIDDLHRAGIKVWMLTGDKVETAEQIGLSCGLYDQADTLIRIAEADLYASDGTSTTATAAGALTGAAAVSSLSWRDTLKRAATTASPNVAHPTGERRTAPAPHRPVARSQAAVHAWMAIGKDAVHNVRHFGWQVGCTVRSRVPTTLARTSAPNEEGPTSSTARSVLIVQGGHVLEEILTTPHLRGAFAQVASQCVSVICARSTPSQKAEVTRFVRSLGAMTLAIGDGGNDVAMLQEAHVGVGIVGKEGQQAARAADFCVAQFSDVHALVFVHGQQAYARTAYVIKYSFYKSMLISFIQLAYNVVGTYYSGGTYWNSFSLTMWNGFYTLPHTLLFCLDRCAPRVVLERTPALYKETRRSLDMRPADFFGVFVLKGVLQSVILLWLSNHLFGPHFADVRDGTSATHDIAFSVSYSALMLSQAVTVYLDSHSVTLWNALALFGMPLLYIVSTQWFSDVRTVQYFGVFARTLHVEVWLVVLAEVAVLTLPFMISDGVRAALWPNPRDTLRHAELQRQTQLSRYRVYRHAQSFLVRWCGAAPEAPSAFSLTPEAGEAVALDMSVTHAV